LALTIFLPVWFAAGLSLQDHNKMQSAENPSMYLIVIQ
jgi:hypothetical protein